MTVKEYNAIGVAAYEQAVKIPEVEEAMRRNGVAMIYDIREGQKHEIWTVAHTSQVSDKTLSDHGFTSEAAITLRMWLNRLTKCAYFG